MPPSANIKINGAAASSFDAPIDTLVQLDNANTGGETTYLWEFVDQPDGAADAFSNAAIQNPTLTPLKEGTYLLRLTVNQGQGVLERVDAKLIRVLHLKHRLPMPAAGETTQSGVDGWKDEGLALNDTLTALASDSADPFVYVANQNKVGSPALGTICYLDSRVTIKAGLPGQEVVPGFQTAQATDPQAAYQPLGVLDSTVVVGGTTATGAMVRIRTHGVAPNLIAIPGGVTVALDDAVWLSDAGQASFVPGTFPRRIGRVVGFDGGVTHAYWAIESHGGAGRRTKVNPAAYDDWGGTGWTKQTLGAILGWSDTLATGTGLLVPLDLAVGELIYKVSCRVKQADPTGKVTINLCHADATGAEVVDGTVTSDASTLNKDVAVPMPHDASRAFDFVEVLASVSHYLRIDASGGAGNLRVVGTTDCVILPPGSKPGT